MVSEMENPGVLPGTRRVDATVLTSKNDGFNNTPALIDLQVRRIIARYAISVSMARLVAEIAFSCGRAPS